MSSKKNSPLVDWLQIDSSAPGKFIISGEYSVVYDKQAIAAAIDLRTHVIIRPGRDDLVRLNLKDLGIERAWPIKALAAPRLVSKNSCIEFNDAMPTQLSHLLSAKYCSNPDDCYLLSTSSPNEVGDSHQNQPATNEAFHKKRDLRKKAHDATVAFLLLYLGIGDSFGNSARVPIDVEVKSDVPVGSGLGSSSAYSVALCGALMKVFLASVENYIISNWAFNIDKYFHGRPSGVDNSIVSVGGYILFQNGVSRSTRTLSEKVITQLQNDPATVNALFSTINEVTTQVWRKMYDPDFTPRHITGQLQANQHYLNQLGVGHEKLDEIFAKAEQYHLTAKQTGAGGGGTAFVLYDQSEDSENIERLSETLIASGFSVHDHVVGCEGLIVKITPDPDKQFQLCDS